MLSYQQAYSLNQFIDYIHNPYRWSYGAVLALAFGVESYLPKINNHRSYFENLLNSFKFWLMLFYSIILLGQGAFGGCIIQIPQNWIARMYMNKSEWYPYGVVYREYISSDYWLLLQFFYLVLGVYTLDRCLVFYQKFVKFRDVKPAGIIFLPGLSDFLGKTLTRKPQK